jgi:hypothetical protein
MKQNEMGGPLRTKQTQSLFIYLFLKKEYFNVTLKVIKIDLFI